jgi:hypothetical protein
MSCLRAAVYNYTGNQRGANFENGVAKDCFTYCLYNQPNMKTYLWTDSNTTKYCYCLPGANFINILHTHFSYERHFGSFFKVHVTRKSYQKGLLYKKRKHWIFMKLSAEEFVDNEKNMFSLGAPKNCPANLVQRDCVSD